MARTLSQSTLDFASAELPVPEHAAIAHAKTVKKSITSTKNLQAHAPSISNKKPSKRGRKSLKEMNTDKDSLNVPSDEVLFEKQYYSIGEVASMFCENQSLIRYWETEFDILQPKKNRKGDRFFRPVDIKNLLLIYDLLRRRKFTIEGAKTYLKKGSNTNGTMAEEKFAMIQSLERLKNFLLQLKASL
jgi:DNA-binding transcriptional MerR regulator